MPVLLAPVLGNPLALASFGIDPNASFPDKVCCFCDMILPRLRELRLAKTEPVSCAPASAEASLAKHLQTPSRFHVSHCWLSCRCRAS